MQDVVLTTPRLKLRPMVEGDIPAHFALFADPEVARYWSREPWTDMTQAEESIRAIIAAREDGSEVRFGIELLSTGELIGNVGLHHFFGQNRRCEIGYALVSKCGTRAMRPKPCAPPSSTASTRWT